MQFSKWGHPHTTKLVEDSLLKIPPDYLEGQSKQKDFRQLQWKTFSNFLL